MSRRRQSMVRTMKALAIACCLVVGALPFGQIPNFVGRCGQKLCHCPHEVNKDTSPLPEKPAEPKHYLTFSTDTLSGAEETVALQSAFSPFVTPNTPVAPVVTLDTTTVLDLQYSTARPPGFVAEITTPPPRLNA